MLILHGDNLAASREALVLEKERAGVEGREIVDLSARHLELETLKQSLESPSFFKSERLVVIESLFSLPGSARKERLLKYLKKEEIKVKLIFWESKQLDGRSLRPFASQAQIRLFKLPALIFKFLDSLNPKNSKTALLLLNNTLKNQPPELVFYLLCRRIRDLIVVKDLGKKGLAGLAPWQQARLLTQAGFFSLEKLIEIYAVCLKIDWEQKTGRSWHSLEGELDLLVLSLLE
ncbi:MAG: hypothetical protein JW991_01375 [Candidatus Pacebacteria bacterium]|nr:hypothetical protein [Candidatus Paceibacterota bacterium]